MNFETQNCHSKHPLISKLLWKQTQEVYESMKSENYMNGAKKMPSLTIQAIVLIENFGEWRPNISQVRT